MFRFITWMIAVMPMLSLQSTPLDDYIATPDSCYRWEILKTTKTEDYQTFQVQLTSQQWLSEKELDTPIWKHELMIVVPKDLKTKTATLTISGGISNVETGNAYAEIPLEELALKTHAIACQVSLVPNQDIKFKEEFDERYREIGRREDALVAYTWNKYLKCEDAAWPLRLPMTKSVTRSMDAVQEILRQQLKIDVDGFILIGKSKRGWTAWTAAATDKRVKAIVPLVIDLLNLKQSFQRHYMAYGNWSPAVRDYVDISLDKKCNDPSFTKLMSFVEPFSYNERFTMPKYIINASGDEFFLPDTSSLYFKELQGQKHLLYLPNTGHLITPDMYQETVIAYLQFLLTGTPLPTYDWKVENNNLIVTSKEKPLYVNLWQAHNPNARDFRVMTIGKNWKSSRLEPQADGSYKAPLPLPEKGWSAYYLEMVYPSPEGLNFRVGTDIIILPDTFPFNSPW